MKIDKKLLRALIIFGTAFIFINVLAFLIPFSRGIAFWTAYSFLMISLAVQFVISYISASKAFVPKNGVRYYPLLRVGTIYLAVQIVASLIFFLTDAHFTPAISWIPAVVCLLILGISCAVLYSTYSGIKVVEHVDEKTKVDTAFISELTVDADILRKQTDDTELQKKLQVLYETIRYSDPVSSPALKELEQNILEQMNQLKSSVMLNDSENAGLLIQKINTLMYERNQKCKLFK